MTTTDCTSWATTLCSPSPCRPVCLPSRHRILYCHWRNVLSAGPLPSASIQKMDLLTKILRSSTFCLSQCYKEDGNSKNPDCPVCSKSLNKLAQPLPMAHCANSRLVCKISGEVMNENNPPMMLPNGYVYGYNVRTRRHARLLLLEGRLSSGHPEL